MKRIVILSLLMSFGFSQFKAGKKSIGGGVEFIRSSLKFTLSDIGDIEVIETGTVIMPKGEYFVTDRLSIGGALSYSMLSNTMSIDGEEVYSSADDPLFENPMGYGFFAKYFMGTAYGHLGFYEPNNSADGDEHVGIGAGYLMPLTDTIYIDTQFTYRHLVDVKGSVSMEANYYNLSEEGIKKESGMQIYGSIGVVVVF